MRRRALFSLCSIGVLAACDGGRLTASPPIATPDSPPSPVASSARLFTPDNAVATATRGAELAQLATLVPLGTAAVQPLATPPATIPTPRVAPLPSPPTPPTPPATPLALAPVSRMLTLVRSGFGQYGGAIGVGFLVCNTERERTLENSAYRVTAFDVGDTALAASDGFIEAVLPGQTLGIGMEIPVPPGTPVMRITVQLGAGSLAVVPYPALPVTGDAVLAAGIAPTVRGTVRSSNPEELPQVRASTILYNAAGEIVGGGAVTVPAVPPRGQAAVTMPVVYTGTPVKVELYAALSSRTLRG